MRPMGVSASQCPNMRAVGRTARQTSFRLADPPRPVGIQPLTRRYTHGANIPGQDAPDGGLASQRSVAYGMAGVIGVIGFLMSTKPELW